MIIPITHESEWLTLLRGHPQFDPGTERLVVLSPHPDDETLGVGGLIASHLSLGNEVTVIAVTDGENAYEDGPRLGSERIQEQERALLELGQGRAEMVRLHLPDGGVTPEFERLLNLTAPWVTEKTHLIAPWTGDFHPDHEACGRVAKKLPQATGARLSWYFFWTWHRGIPDLLSGLDLSLFPVSRDLKHRKLKALRCHKSQLHHDSGYPILPLRLLAPARRDFEVFAAA